MNRPARIVWLLLAFAALTVFLAARRGLIVVPDRWNPWSPLVVADEPGLLTPWKLRRTSNDDALCLAVLGQVDEIEFVALPDRVTNTGCGFSNAVRIDRTSASIGEPFSLSCRTALSLVMWERHVLQPEADRVFGSRVRSIDHYGSYACRNVYGRQTGARSRHATADAFDIAGFVLADGRRIRVVRDWVETTRLPGSDTGLDTSAGENQDAARFLRALHRGACRYFDAVLGPEYNAAHADHFHFDRGGYRACR